MPILEKPDGLDHVTSPKHQPQTGRNVEANRHSRRDFLGQVVSAFSSWPADPRIDWETVYPRRAEATYRLVDGGGLEMYGRGRLPGYSVRRQLNAVAQMIWDSCTGQHSVAQIARALARAFQVDVATGLRDTVRFLGEMHDQGVLTFSREASAEPLYDVILASPGEGGGHD